jgi:hypothetical protein
MHLLKYNNNNNRPIDIPADFAGRGHFIPDNLGDRWGPFTMTNQGLQINLPIIELPSSGLFKDRKLVGAILPCRPRKAKELQNLQDLRDLEELQRQELKEQQQLLVIPLISEEGSQNRYNRVAGLGRSCFVQAEAAYLRRQTIYIKQPTDSLPWEAESSRISKKCDGFLIQRRDPIIVGYKCRSIPNGLFDDTTYIVRRPLGDRPSWEVKLSFKKESKGLGGILTAFDVVLGHSERKGQYCRIDTLFNTPRVFADSDTTSDSGGGVKVSLVGEPLKLASGDHFTIVDIESQV